MADTTTWLTQESYDRLQSELAELTGSARTDIAKKIEAARSEGDLKENGGYHAAKDEQGRLEARIRQITELLRTATVGEPAGSDGTVAPGALVTATIAGEKSVFLLGNREIAPDAGDLDVYPESSPLGQTILGLAAGARASYTAPNGKKIAVKILAVESYLG